MKIIDMADGAKILGGDKADAQEMLKYSLAMFPETRRELKNSYCESDLSKFQFMVHKFYGGMLYIGAPVLRQAAKKLLTALVKKEKHLIQQLYQNMLDEMTVLEKIFKNKK